MKFLYDVQFIKGGRAGRCFLLAASSEDVQKYEEREGVQVILSRPVASTFGDIFARANEDVLFVDMSSKDVFF